jgi:hypothetical protein
MDRDFYFLGAKLKSKIEQFVKQSTPQETIKTAKSVEESKFDCYPQRSDDISLKFDQLSIHNQSLEREIGLDWWVSTYCFDIMAELLKKKHDKSRNEQIKNASNVEMLKSQLLQVGNELDLVKNERDQLYKDAETFERWALSWPHVIIITVFCFSYVDTLYNDQKSLKSIIQKVLIAFLIIEVVVHIRLQIQDAFEMTKEELSKVSVCYQDALRYLKACNEVIEKEQKSNKQLRDEVSDLQNRIDVEYAEKTELMLYRDSMAQTVTSLEQQILQLDNTLSSERKLYLIESRVKTAISDISETSDKWMVVANRLVNGTAAMQSELSSRFDVKLLPRHLVIGGI